MECKKSNENLIELWPVWGESQEEVSVKEEFVTSDLQNKTLEVNIFQPAYCVSNAIKMPSLPAGKDKHFFVSYSTEDSERVIRYVEELENRFSLNCVYSDRDFQPGKDITENIKEGMARSLKVLLFLSPNFHESGWCKFEREYAFITSIQNGTDCVIPVMLEKCDIPAALVPLTYVDATRPDIDVPKRIVTALEQNFTYDGILPKNLTDALSNFENGYSFIIQATRDPRICKLRPAKYMFECSEETFDNLNRHKVQIPHQLLQKCTEVVNKQSVMWSYDFLDRRYMFLWCLMALPLFLSLRYFCFSLARASLATRNRFNDDDLRYLESVYFVATVVCVCLPNALSIALTWWLLPDWCNNKQRYIGVQMKLWNLFAEEFIERNVLVIFCGRKNKPATLHIMRYNMARCKAYVKSICVGKYADKKSASLAEEIASELFKHGVLHQLVLPTVQDEFDSVNEAPYNRHNVRKGKKCLCQFLEDFL